MVLQTTFPALAASVRAARTYCALPVLCALSNSLWRGPLSAAILGAIPGYRDALDGRMR